jgi:hypothetical protein
VWALVFHLEFGILQLYRTQTPVSHATVQVVMGRRRRRRRLRVLAEESSSSRLILRRRVLAAGRWRTRRREMTAVTTWRQHLRSLVARRVLMRKQNAASTATTTTSCTSLKPVPHRGPKPALGPTITQSHLLHSLDIARRLPYRHGPVKHTDGVSRHHSGKCLLPYRGARTRNKLFLDVP